MEEKKMNSLDKYVSDFEEMASRIPAFEFDEFSGVKSSAIEKLKELGFPTQKHEEWKYTNLTQLLNKKFTPVPLSVNSHNAIIDVDSLPVSSVFGNKLVFVNGYLHFELSDISYASRGLIIDNISTAMMTDPELVKRYISRKYENGFSALNMAFFQDGAFIRVEDRHDVEIPLHLIFLTDSPSESLLSQPRNIIVLGKGSSLKIIESHFSLSSQSSFTNAVNEIHLEENSVLAYHKIQDNQGEHYLIDRTSVIQQKNSTFNSFTITTGGELVRNDLQVNLKEENCECNLFGLYLCDGNRLVDNHTAVDHMQPNCSSNELYKGILKDTSKGVFNGKVFVRPGAQKTNAYQSNKNMLLSEQARVDTKPQLEIFADDVRCSHGATVGRMDDESLFYLKSRGIDAEMAGKMLVSAFANDVLEKIQLLELREKLEEMLSDRLK